MFGLFGGTNQLREERNREAHKAFFWQVKHDELQAKWNGLVGRINKLGGEEFLQNAKLSKDNKVSQFTDDELRSLLQLVHPDKHSGKQSAVTLTQKINSLRK